jgi:hypothetical protein
MIIEVCNREIRVPEKSNLTQEDYLSFLEKASALFGKHSHFLAPDEGAGNIELAHLIPTVPETLLAIYMGINDAVCHKGLIMPYLLCHAHNNVFVFDPEDYPGGDDVPTGTVDASKVISAFAPPNETWNNNWTYVMIDDPERSFQSLWKEKGYIDMIPAKLEDFTMLSDTRKSKVCWFIDPKAFAHPVNASRLYLKDARARGEKNVDQYGIPEQLKGEFKGLDPVELNTGEKLYIANPDFSPCAHGWSNIHSDNDEYAVINEISAVPMELVVAKPPVKKQYAQDLKPPHGSADMTTDYFRQMDKVYRKPLLAGNFEG